MFLKTIHLFHYKDLIKRRFLQNYHKLLILRSEFSLMSTKSMADDSNLKPPDRVSGLTTLNKSLFEKTITVSCLIVHKDIKLSSVVPLIRKYLLKLENFKPVKSVSNEETHIYLNPEMINKWDDLNTEVKLRLIEMKLNEKNLVTQSHTLTYDNFSLDAILKAVLPPNEEGVSSFTQVGHIVHVNLREHLLPFKDLIGQVLYEKVSNCRTVVNKVANIDNTYRNFQMEILRGDPDMETTVKENKCLFKFDFSKVYWNSRLCTEHERIVAMIKSNDVVFDVFAGVGPFSVPLARKKCRVFANDLNPESHKWLLYNSKSNNIDANFLKCYNKDGRDFILTDIKKHLTQYLNVNNIHIIMNLPALAVEFLSAFVGLYKDDEIGEVRVPPTVIIYCFAKGENYEKIAKNLLYQNIGRNIDNKIIDIFRVRTVSSMKEMMRIRFKLDRDILVEKVSLKRKRDNGEEQKQENE